MLVGWISISGSKGTSSHPVTAVGLPLVSVSKEAVWRASGSSHELTRSVVD